MKTPTTRQLEGYDWTGDLPPVPMNKDELRLLAQMTGTVGKTVDDLIHERDLVFFDQGSEHKVYTEKNSDNVVKLAYKGTGWTYEYKETPDGKGQIALRPATVRDYVKRLSRINNAFEKTMEIIGVYVNTATGNSYIAHAQKYLGSRENEPTQAEINMIMTDYGFRQLNPEIFDNLPAHAIYYNPGTNLIVGDCAPRNFRKFNGRPYPIDVIAQRPEGRFKELAMENMLPESGAHQTSLHFEKTDFPGVDEFLEKLQVAKARGASPEATAAALVKGMEGPDATKIPLLFVAREFLQGWAGEDRVRLVANDHFRQVSRLRDASTGCSQESGR